MILYHICKPEDKGKLKMGYIGITNNYEWRKQQHFKYSHSNKLLQRSIKKYDAIMYPVTEASLEVVVLLEVWLRPEDGMGWNLVKGGGLPPSATGRVWTDKQKQDIPKRGKDNSRWLGYWSIDDIEYESTREAALALGVTPKTIRDRTKNPNFPNYQLRKL